MDKVLKSAGVRRSLPSRLAWLPIPLLLLAMAVFWAADLQGTHESAYLLLTLNLVFSTPVCVLIAYLAARSFLVSGAPGLLLLGCGVVIWAPAGVVATAAAHGDANISITIYNSCVWLSGLCHLAGVSLSLRPRRSLSPAALWLPAAYALAAGAVMLVTLATLAGWIPAFFVEGQGGTPVRQLVLMSAMIMFALTASLLSATSRKPLSDFAYWYALALTLLVTGLAGVLLQTYHASVLGWTGRVTQSLGGLYMLIAAVASVRESRVWGISLEAALQESEERYRILFETAPDAIVVHRNGRFLCANGAALALTGAASFEQLARHTILDFFRPQDREQAAERTRLAMAGSTLPIREATLLRLDGRESAVEFQTTPLDFQGTRAILTIIRDITERRRAEEVLRIKDSAIASSLNAIAMADLQGRLTYVNPAFVKLWGYENEHEVLGKPVLDFWQEPQRALEVIQAIRKGGGWVGELVALRKDRVCLSLYLSASTVRNDEGTPICMMSSFVDITERKRAEAALRDLNATLESKVAARTAEVERERQRLYAVLEAVPAMICLLTPDYHVAFANRRFREMFGESHGRHCYEFCYGRTEPCEFCETYQVLKTGKPHRWEVTAADGRTIIDAYDFPFTDVDGSPLILEMDMDITERKQAEAALKELNEALEHRARQLQKLTLELTEAEDRERRRIAALLHEDLQQQIAGAKFHLNLVRNRARHDVSQQAMVEAVDEMLREAIEKSRRLSHDLSPAVLHLNDLAEVLQWLARQMRTRHGLVVRVEISEEARVQSEALTMFLFRAAQELLFNVIKHAGVSEAAVRVRRRGRCLCLSVTDTGRGFDPRELRETPGFGLLSIRERVELLGGRMTIKSANGAGSRLHILVPCGGDRDKLETANHEGCVAPQAPGPRQAFSGRREREKKR